MKRTDPNTLEFAVKALESQFGNLGRVKERIKNHHIETPSWGYGDSGTRFGVFRQPGVPRNAYERIEDAGVVHKYTGVAPSVAVHIPWDKVEDFKALGDSAREQGLRIGAINPNVFQDQDYKLGSLTNENPAIRRKAVDQISECVEIGKAINSNLLSLWFADGTNYPGQGDFRRRKGYMLEGLGTVYDAMPGGMRMLLEYKLFEPAWYHTDLADWGMAYSAAQRLGEQAQVLVDLGHHPLGANIEHIVAFLIDEGKLGGFHLNDKKYADDDVSVASFNPYQMFLIYNELAAAEDDPGTRSDIAYMLDQSHNIKPKIEEMIQSVVACQTQYAKALLVDRAALTDAQNNGDVVRAEEILQDAYQADVRPLLARVRIEMGLDPDPVIAFRESGYSEKAARERQGAAGQVTLGG